jgi:hypothetical protein
MVQAALEQGLCAASGRYGCSCNTVPNRLRRSQQQGKPGLKQRSWEPQRIPHTTPTQLIEHAILQARD